jgi:iron complex outermembrane receptor protein
LNIGGALNTYNGDHYDIITWQNYNTLYLEPHRYYQDNARKTDGNIFAKANFNVFNHFYLTGDLQLRQVHYAFTGKDATGADLPSSVNLSFFNPKAGISYEPSQSHRFYASVSVGQKEPVRDDYRASTAASRPQSEYLTDYEGGYHFSGHQFTGGINVYYMDYRRQLVLNGKINDVGEYVRESIGDSYRAGVELEGTWAITKKWLLTGNITASQNKIKAYDQYVYDEASQTSIRYTYFNMKLAYSPDLISASSIHFKPMKSINLSFITKYVGEQFLDNTTSNERKIAGYINNDFRAEWSPSIKGFKKVCFRAAVLNLFDAKYSTNGYTYYGNYYFPQAGINFMGGITIGW